MKILDENLARIRAHLNNIHRYRSLLKKDGFVGHRAPVRRAASVGGELGVGGVDFPDVSHGPFHAPEPSLAGDDGGRAVTDMREMLIYGSEKVIFHYRQLLASAKTEKERELYLSRIEREQRLLGQLRDGLPRRSAA
ncbi:hypothetical protein [Bradyrhizobium sp. USDA 4454]